MNRFQFRIWKGFLNTLPMIAIQSVILLLGLLAPMISQNSYQSTGIQLLSNLMYLFGGLITIVDISYFVQGYIKAGN